MGNIVPLDFISLLRGLSVFSFTLANVLFLQSIHYFIC